MSPVDPARRIDYKFAMLRQLTVLRILWAGIGMSTVVFLATLFVLAPQHVPPGLEVAAGIGFAAFSSSLASLLLPEIIYRNAAARLRIAARPEDDPAGMPGVTKRLVASDPQATLRAALPAFQTTLILGLALAESVALFGFVLGFLGFPLPLVVGFFLVSWALIALRYPTLDKILAPLEKAHGLVVPRQP